MSSSMFRRRSRARVRKHRAHWQSAIRVPELVRCPEPGCGSRKPAHLACPDCGRYNGRPVLQDRR
ncbi:50S ribosomal protein L32 [Nocardiopsis coralliicola]